MSTADDMSSTDPATSADGDPNLSAPSVDPANIEKSFTDATASPAASKISSKAKTLAKSASSASLPRDQSAVSTTSSLSEVSERRLAQGIVGSLTSLIPNSIQTSVNTVIGMREKTPAEWYHFVSEGVANAAVSAAVVIKKSPIPDAIASITGSTSEGPEAPEDTADLEQKIMNVSQILVGTTVAATGIMAKAAVRAGAAYKRTPGFSDNKDVEQRTKRFQKVYDVREKLIRVAECPGAMPLAALVDAATQTDDLEFDAHLMPHEQGHPDDGDGHDAALLNPSRGLKKKISGILISGATMVASSILERGTNLVLKSPGAAEPVGSAEGSPTSQPTLRKRDSIASLRKKDSSSSLSRHGESKSHLRTLNVGGAVFTTTVMTLTADENSELAHWFGAKASTGTPAMSPSAQATPSSPSKEHVLDDDKAGHLVLKDGVYHIDREGKHFHHVLNYLRHGCRVEAVEDALPDDYVSLCEIYAEAVFYNLEKLAAVVETKMIESKTQKLTTRIRHDVYELVLCILQHHIFLNTLFSIITGSVIGALLWLIFMS
ncbi:uncharacterized protein BJ171DRAFT_148840 [Polychytrium aggregatum]|uniref:uncharacterized protein n=1 Tax=Polychytrium aggregatum TaxID=110093 RepID=UPI0022FDF1C8|nr:uncharacterized protein BJ171DRAFT_148840 [Polychytrium aggregatum]KAI9203277.1 hypothetical protein BJ171DRAFT_148840 [Polychytrium aggregatum]